MLFRSGQVGTYSFAPGITTLKYTVTDAAGNTTIDSLTVENTKEFFAGGDGTEQDPYQITDWEQLYNVRFFSGTGPDSKRYFVLNNDLNSHSGGYDTYASESANGGMGWEPGYSSYIYLDGNGFAIADFKILREFYFESGLFRYLDYSEILNLDLKDFLVQGRFFTCFNCNHTADADENAAHNVRNRIVIDVLRERFHKYSQGQLVPLMIKRQEIRTMLCSLS